MAYTTVSPPSYNSNRPCATFFRYSHFAAEFGIVGMAISSTTATLSHFLRRRTSNIKAIPFNKRLISHTFIGTTLGIGLVLCMQRVVDRVLDRGRGGAIEQVKELDENIWKQLEKHRILNRSFHILSLGSFVMLQRARLKLPEDSISFHRCCVAGGLFRSPSVSPVWVWLRELGTIWSGGGGGARKQYTGRIIWRPSRDA